MYGPLNVKFAFVFCTTPNTKQFSLGCVAKQSGEGMKRFADIMGNSEPFNHFTYGTYVYEQVAKETPLQTEKA
jgi:hypothetical protein